MGFGIGIGLSGKLDNVARMYMAKQAQEDNLAMRKAQLSAKEAEQADKKLAVISNAIAIKAGGYHPYIQPQVTKEVTQFTSDIAEKSAQNPLYGNSSEAQGEKDKLIARLADLKRQSDEKTKADYLIQSQPQNYVRKAEYEAISQLPIDQQPAAFMQLQNGTPYTTGSELISDMPKEKIVEDIKKNYPQNYGVENVFSLDKETTRNLGKKYGYSDLVATDKGLKLYLNDYYQTHKPLLGKYADFNAFYDEMKDSKLLKRSDRTEASSFNIFNNSSSGSGGIIKNEDYIATAANDQKTLWDVGRTSANTNITARDYDHSKFEMLVDNGNGQYETKDFLDEGGNPIKRINGDVVSWAQTTDGQWHMGVMAKVPKYRDSVDPDTGLRNGKKEKDGNKTEEVVIYMPLDTRGKSLLNASTPSHKTGMGLFPPGVKFNQKGIITNSNKGQSPNSGTPKKAPKTPPVKW